MDNCYGCGTNGHMKIDCTVMKAKGRENVQAQASAPYRDTLKKNHLYDLRCRTNQDESSNVFVGMLQLFSVNVYALLDPSATLSFVTLSKE